MEFVRLVVVVVVGWWYDHFLIVFDQEIVITINVSMKSRTIIFLLLFRAHIDKDDITRRNGL